MAYPFESSREKREKASQDAGDLRKGQPVLLLLAFSFNCRVRRECILGEDAGSRTRSSLARSRGERLSADVLQRFSLTQRTKPRLVLTDVALNLFGIGPGILPKRPANCFAQEKLFRVDRRLDARVEEL